jgi:hypothetical protein
MSSEKEWWEIKPTELKHYKTQRGARNYALRTPGRWYIAICDDSVFTNKDEKEWLGSWVVILDSRYEWICDLGLDFETKYDIKETIEN